MLEAEGERTELYNALINDDQVTDSMGREFDTVTSNKVVQDEIDSQRGKARENSLNTARLRAVLDSFGDADFNQQLSRGRNAQTMGMYGNFGQGSAAVVPAELRGAQSAGAGRAMLGQLLSTAGQVGMFAGGSGMKNPFAKAGNASPGINLNNVLQSGVPGAPYGPGITSVPSGPGIQLPRF
jgi:hypothetical protein